MRAVTPGSAKSRLIVVSQAGGSMYSELHGNRAQKAKTLYDWVVTWKAQEK
jgi:hypothetical protein